MVKECKVLLRNQYVMVIEFDGKEIQMPSDHSDFNKVLVKYENGLEELLDNVGYKYEINGDIYDIIVTDDMKKQAIAVLSDYELIAVKSAVNDLEDAIRNII